MRKLYLITMIFFTYNLIAQVGINTLTPKSALEVVGKNDDGAYEKGDGILIPRLSDIPTQSGVDEGELVYVNGNGFYFWNGQSWKSLINSLVKVKFKDGSPDPSAAVYNEGNVGIGIENPTRKLEIVSGADPFMRISTDYSPDSQISTSKLLTVEKDGDVAPSSVSIQGVVDKAIKALSVPRSSYFVLETSITDFLKDIPAGKSQNLPMAMVANNIDSLSFDDTNNTITIKGSGIYEFKLTYEGHHNTPTTQGSTDCTISSYFIDFPQTEIANPNISIPSGSKARIHSTASHVGGGRSNHGGTISFVSNFKKNKSRSFKITMGRGQSGDCGGDKNDLFAFSTYLIVTKL